MNERYDLVVIGSGPAGEKGATQAAACGKRVALVERAPYLGGTGINTGTVPSKTLRETALYFSGLRQRGLYGIDYSLKESLSVQEFLYRERLVVEEERKIVRRNLERNHVEVIWGTASLKDAHTVAVRCAAGEQRELVADFILIATGSSPHRPQGIPFEHPLVYDSDEILHELERIPRSVAVIGGGVIGCEYASIFTALDVHVTLIDGRDRILPFVDTEIAERLRQRLEHLGLRMRCNERVAEVEPGPESVRLRLTSGEELVCDIALFAAGRTSNVAGLGLEAVGVELGKRGLILVNDHYQTCVPNIYAAGDVIGFPALASTSMEQARVAVSHAFDQAYKQHMSPIQPLAVYTIPEIATVGLSEDACTEQGVPYLVGRAYYTNNPRGQIIGDTSGMVKLVFSPDGRKLLGAHLIGELASELVHIGAHVIAEDGTIDTFIEGVYNYPTLADCYKYAAYDGFGAWQEWEQTNGSR